MNKTIEKMYMINQLYENNYNNHIIKDKSTLSKKEMNIDKLRIDLMMKKSFTDLDNAEVRKSEIHGNGVFAKKDIKIDEIITFYPADILQLYIGDDESILRFSKKYLEFYNEENFKSNFDKISNCYRYNCNNRNSIIGDPAFIDNPNYLGHMINDSISHNKTRKSKKIQIQFFLM